jgi:hypothetical protein
VPADDKRNADLIISAVVLEALKRWRMTSEVRSRTPRGACAAERGRNAVVH